MYNKNGLSQPKGSSPDLMPSIMGALDAYIGTNNKQNTNDKDQPEDVKTSTPKRSHQLSTFANLSPCVQKLLSNVPEQEISKKFSSEETLGPNSSNRKLGHNRFGYRSMRSPEKTIINKSNENLDNNIFSPTVNKMLSNLPDTELSSSARNLSINSRSSSLSRNSSYLYHNSFRSTEHGHSKQLLYHSDTTKTDSSVSSNSADCSVTSDVRDFSGDTCPCEDTNIHQNSDGFSIQRPLGSYLHSSQGIASRTPVGRKNMGKYLQVPSENSTSANSNSTVSSSEVSRPVSLTSLGSCSSSGSSGHNQHGSAYLASAESLDSDPEPAGSQGSADSGIAEQESTPSMSPEQRVLQEVLETETVYVADLNEVIEGYLKQWKADPECPLAEYLQNIFGNIEEIYRFNRSFLKQLEDTNCDPTKTANVFLQNDSGFSVYNEYCTNYPRTMHVLKKLLGDNKMTPLFREKQLALGHALPLGAYLLKPVQRILKYHLLLQRLSKQCEIHHKPAVDLALTTMTGIASDIDNMKRKNDTAVRVQEIQSQLYGWTGPDLTALGELIAEGSFRVQGARGRRQVFLFEKVLLLAKRKQDEALAYKTHIMCSNLMLVEQVRGEPISFQVLPFDNPRLQCTLKARSLQNKRDWTLQIKRVILENYSAVIPNHARQLVMQLGQNLQENEDTTERWSPLKHNATPHYLERRCRVRKTRDLSNRRASSQDRSFPSLGSWRRKSEPSMIPQYDTKTIPKKITKIKKSKEPLLSTMGSSTFYTDLSDSEAGDVVSESTESLMTQQMEDKVLEVEGGSVVEEEGEEEREEPSRKCIENNLEKIVSELLMQNQEFHKVFNREHTRHPRRNINSEPGPMWYEDHRPKLPSKADSLPRSFQLNDQIDRSSEKNELILDRSLKENPDVDVEEPHENDLTSRLDDNEHPEHKIYRKSAIRLSILQRIRMIMSEEQKRNYKYPLRKQGSKGMGEKIAHPDYVDPQKLFLNSRNSSTVNLSLDSEDKTEDLMGERVELDMSLNEKEVLKEIEKRLNDSTADTGHNSSQNHNNDSTNSSSNSNNNVNNTSSHQNSTSSDSYYESILENSLTEEYVRDKSGKLVAKQDSFNNNDKHRELVIFSKQQHKVFTSKPSTINGIKSPTLERRPIIKRPTKAPPPIPVKPSRLVNSNSNNSISNSNCNSLGMVANNSTVSSTETITKNCNSSAGNLVSCTKSFVQSTKSIDGCNSIQTSWVKTMVGRFE